MNPNKALWEKGDFTRLAATMRVLLAEDDPIVPRDDLSPDHAKQQLQGDDEAGACCADAQGSDEQEGEREAQGGDALRVDRLYLCGITGHRGDLAELELREIDVIEDRKARHF